jgi:hypothetical protein
MPREPIEVPARLRSQFPRFFFFYFYFYFYGYRARQARARSVLGAVIAIWYTRSTPQATAEIIRSAVLSCSRWGRTLPPLYLYGTHCGSKKGAILYCAVISFGVPPVHTPWTTDAKTAKKLAGYNTTFIPLDGSLLPRSKNPNHGIQTTNRSAKRCI